MLFPLVIGMSRTLNGRLDETDVDVPRRSRQDLCKELDRAS